MQRLTTRPGLVSLKVKPNWFTSKWLAGICIAWFLLVSGATAQTTEPSPAPQVAATQVTDAQAASQNQSTSDIQSLRERLQRQEDVVLEMRHKTVDWWLQFLAFAMAVFSVLGAGLFYLIGQKAIKEQSQVSKDEAQRIEKELEETRQVARDELKKAEALVVSIKQYEQEAREIKTQMTKEFTSGSKLSPDEQKSLEEEAQSLQENPQASESDKLRARAVLASQEGDQSVDQAQQAYDLWQALTILQPRDASAQFNTGYWAQELFEQKAAPSSAYWLQKLKQHYGIALEIKPDKYEALNNWGDALAVEAEALAGQDLTTARKLWKETGLKYSEAFKIEPDDYEILNNWGSALAAEAEALAGQDLTTARELWQDAGDKYSKALKIKPDGHEALNNWGVALTAEATALAGQDLDAARRLWQEAGGKFSGALRVRPNFHEVLSNWGVAFLDEICALKTYEPENKTEIEVLLKRVQGVLEKPSLSGNTQGQAQYAYVLASVYAMQGKATECVQQLKTAQEAEALPSKIDLEKNNCLDSVRESEVFQKWWSSL